MSTYAPQALSNAVAAICPDIQSHVADAEMPDELRLWWELSSCILSSQVPYNLAVAAADMICAEGLFLDKHADLDSLTLRVVGLLSKPLSVDGRYRAYRFPVIRARQLVATHTAVVGRAGCLLELVNGFRDANDAREWFVRFAPGLGPKQASMFLRNAGVSYDLAILDRHVLNYMSVLGIYKGDARSISSLAEYRKHEVALRDHARSFECPVGLLDWAIWIVMRVANRNMEFVAL